MNPPSEPEPDAFPAPEIDHAPLEAPRAFVPPPAPRRRRGNAGPVLLTLVLSGGLGAAGYYAWTHPNPDAMQQVDSAAQQAQAAAERASTLAQQLDALGARVDRLEKAPPPIAPVAAPADLGDLPKRVDDLAAKVDALANRPEPAPSAAPAPDNGAAQQALADLSQRTSQALDAQKAATDQVGTQLGQLGPRLDEIDSRVKTLEQGIGQAKGTAAATARMTRIEAALVALQAGKPLGDIEGAPPALTRFATVAPPTEAALREAFPALADHARKVSEPDLSGRSFWQRALTRMQSAVTVRQGPNVLVGDPAAGILSDARGKVADGDLAGAVTVLRHLDGPAADAMHGWVAQAAALVAARAALADLAAHA